MRIPMWTEITDVGDARVTILRGNSAITTGTYTFAVAVDDDTVVTMEDTVTFGPEETAELEDMYIDETVLNAIDFGDKFEMTLPRDFEWDMDAEDLEFRFTGGLRDIDGNFEIYDFDADGRDLEFRIRFDDESAIAKDRTSEGTITLSGLAITSDSSRFGDVNLTVNGALSEQTVLVAEYLDFAMDISADGDLEEIVAGRFDDGEEGAGFELTTMLFEEKSS